MFIWVKNVSPRLTPISVAILMAALLLVSSIFWSLTKPLSSFKSVDHSREVIAALTELQIKLDNAEKDQWAYYLTKDKTFIEQRDAAINALQIILEKFNTLTFDNRDQQQHLQQLQVAIDTRLHKFNEGQTLFETQGFAATEPVFNRADSTIVNNLVTESVNKEIILLEQRQQNQSIGNKIVIVSIVFLVSLLLLLWKRIQDGAKGRVVIEEKSKEVRESLLKTGALQDAIFNSANFSSIATDAQGVIQIFNVGAERMLGYTAAEVVDKITPAGISDAQEVIARAANLSTELETHINPGFEALVFKASRGIEDIYELTYIRKDGSRFPAVVSVTALRNAQNAIIGYLLIGTDNTVRKQVEAEQAILDQRLRDQQFYTRSLIESNIDALMTTDPRGIISDVNQQMEALTGCTRDELIGAPFKNYFTDPARAEAGINRVLREGKVTNYELTAHARNGVETVVSYNATTFYDRDRKLQGVFAAARDMTERKQFEHTLEQNFLELESAKAAAEKANLAKSDFLSSMSHELRTPLNAVLGFAQLLASDSPPPSSSQKLSIDQILQGGWYLLRLINEILDLAMIESGKVSMSQESIFLKEVLQDCKAMIEPQAQKRGLKMTFSDIDSQLHVRADRTRLKQVMINLLSNAIKYNRVAGAVTVQCVMHGEDRVRISVTDNGAGLSSEQIAQLFQPFNRLGQETGIEEGTGIGLIVTKQLVELMGGAIGLDSTVNVGSVFWIDLDIAAAPVFTHGSETDINIQHPLVEGDELSPLSATRTILYIEDNPANLILVEQLIARRADLKLMTAIDAHIGIKLAREHKPDVILMDINLPGLSGYGALKILSNDPNTAHIPVMALSANAVPRDIVKGLEAGFFRYLTKPIKVNEFMDALDVALHFANENGLTGDKISHS